jgi:acyl-CoA thioesterase-1
VVILIDAARCRGRAAGARFLAWLAFVAAVTLAGCGSNAARTLPTSPDPTAIRRVVVLGDSLSVSPSIAESFPANLQKRIEVRRLPWTVTNAGVYGDTSAEALLRLDPLLTNDLGVLVVALGANDGLQGLAAARVEDNLSEIVRRGQRSTAHVLLCGMETPPTHGLSYSIAFHLIFPRVASTFGVPLVPFLLDGVALVPSLNLPDLVHPNAAGAQRVADNVWPYLEPLLR